MLAARVPTVALSSPRRHIRGKTSIASKKPAALVVAARVVATRAMPEGPYPELAVFDLDACFWDEEMYTLRDIVDPARSVRGVFCMETLKLCVEILIEKTTHNYKVL